MAGKATYKRVMVQVDSVKFYPIEARYSLSRSANQVGRRIGDSLQGRAFIYADIHDISRITQDDVINLWKMATETKDPLHKVAITYYSEDESKVLNNVEFMGWISVFETYNPGAVSRVELVSLSGKRTVVYQGAAAPMSVPAFQRKIDFACTAEPIASVRVTLQSAAVPGWNEIDAIGARVCR